SLRARRITICLQTQRCLHIDQYSFHRCHGDPGVPPSFPTRRSSDLWQDPAGAPAYQVHVGVPGTLLPMGTTSEQQWQMEGLEARSEEHTSELQSRENLVCRLLLEKKKYKKGGGGWTMNVHITYRNLG